MMLMGPNRAKSKARSSDGKPVHPRTLPPVSNNATMSVDDSTLSRTMPNNGNKNNKTLQQSKSTGRIGSFSDKQSFPNPSPSQGSPSKLNRNDSMEYLDELAGSSDFIGKWTARLLSSANSQYVQGLGYTFVFCFSDRG